MSATVEIGQTYTRRIGDSTGHVTIERPCEWGGWYGTNESGQIIRVTEKSLVINKEDTNMANRRRPATRVTAADRRSRRGRPADSAAPQLQYDTPAEPSASEKLDMALSTATADKEAVATKCAPSRKPAAKQAPAVKEPTNEPAAPYGYKADGTPRKRPVPAHLINQPVKSDSDTDTKTDDNNTNKESNIMPVASKPRAARRANKPAVTTETTKVEEPTVDAIAELAAKLAAQMIADMQTNGEITVNDTNNNEEDNVPAPTRKPTVRKRKPAAKVADKSAVTVTLTANTEKRHSWQFSYQGTSKTPLITGCYITKDAIEQFENGAKSMTVEFDRAEGKKHSILFREVVKTGNGVFNGSLYLMRNALKDSGITEEGGIVVTMTVKSDNEITLSVVAA